MKRLALVGLVVVLPLVGLAMPDTVRIPPAGPRRPGAPQAEALFSHWEHARYRCQQCHPSVFPQAPLGFTHAQMSEGKFCGRCHDGRAARAITGIRCEVCHAPR